MDIVDTIRSLTVTHRREMIHHLRSNGLTINDLFSEDLSEYVDRSSSGEGSLLVYSNDQMRRVVIVNRDKNLCNYDLERRLDIVDCYVGTVTLQDRSYPIMFIRENGDTFRLIINGDYVRVNLQNNVLIYNLALKRVIYDNLARSLRDLSIFVDTD